jgi:hypothetical protein
MPVRSCGWGDPLLSLGPVRGWQLSEVSAQVAQCAERKVIMRKLLMLLTLYVILMIVAVQAVFGDVAAQRTSTDNHSTYLPLVLQAAPVEVVIVKETHSRANTYHVIGELVNLTSSPVYSVTLEIRVYDVEDRLLGTSTGPPLFFATVPGQRNPFEGGVNVSYWQVARSEIRVVGWSLSHNPPYAPVTIASAEPRTSNGYLYVSGELRNDTEYVLEDVRVAVWSPSQYFALASHPAADSLAPGATVPYEVAVFMYSTGPPGTPIPAFGVSAQGIVAP